MGKHRGADAGILAGRSLKTSHLVTQIRFSVTALGKRMTYHALLNSVHSAKLIKAQLSGLFTQHNEQDCIRGPRLVAYAALRRR
jgi:hypothetical protein